MAVAKTFTPELIANGRRRYEQTDESVASIATDFAVVERTFNKYVHRWGWTPRKQRPAHDLSPLNRLLEQAKDVPAVRSDDVAATPGPANDSVPEQDLPALESSPQALAASAPGTADADRSSMIERLWCAVEAELAAVERMRAQLGTQPQSPAEAERTARTLESIVRTLKEVDRLRSAEAATTDDDDDDLPRDLDEFRRVLAQRIEAFVASRTDGTVPVGAPEGEGTQEAR